jgi:hypothetical protein
MSFINKIGKLISGSTTAGAATASSRSVARERLSVILASQRGSDLLEGVDMEALQKDVMDVVQVLCCVVRFVLKTLQILHLYRSHLPLLNLRRNTSGRPRHGRQALM